MGAGIESTYGTKVSITNWLRVESVGLKRTVDKVRIPHLGTNGTQSSNRQAHFIASDDAGGAFSFPAAYDDSTLLLVAHAMGANATTGAGPYVHTMTLDTLTPLASLSLEQAIGSGKSEFFEGSRINGFEFSIASGDVAKISIPGIISETSGGLEAQGTPTFPVSSFVKHSEASTLAFNSLVFDLMDITIKVDRKFAKRQLLGSTITQEPCPTDFTTVEGSFTVQLGAEATYGLNAALLADTQGDGVLSFAGAGNNALVITLQNMIITDVARPVSGAGVVTQTVTFICESDGTNEGLEFRFTNDNTAYSDNT